MSPDSFPGRPARRLASATARLALATALLAPSVLAGLPRDLPDPDAPQKPWHGQEDRILDVLRHGEVVSKERLGQGITNPYKVVVELQGMRLKGIWKPIERSLFANHEESYQAEVAAYRLSRWLGLDMVPPTVERKIGRRYGSLQMWIDGCSLFADKLKQQPPDIPDWTRQLNRMWFFDALIDNPDRHAANYLVTNDWQIVLIDHSRALNFGVQGQLRQEKKPERFDRALVERTRALDAEILDDLLGDLLDGSEIKALVHLRDELIAHVDRLAAERGAVVFF